MTKDNVFKRFKNIVLDEKKFNSERISNAIDATIKHIPEYWNKTVNQRLSSGLGSVTSFSDFQALEKAILESEWEKYDHENLTEDVTAYKTNDISGYLGIVEIETLPEDKKFKLVDFKNVGKYSCVVEGIERPKSDFMVIILGNEKILDKTYEIVYTFHNGDPIYPSVLSSDSIELQESYTKKEILELGFKYAKIS